jgi:hypothetical protein
MHMHNVLPRAAAILAIVTMTISGLCGPLAVICRAPGGHFGPRILLFQEHETASCCDCVTCLLPGSVADREGISLERAPCDQPCSDASMTQPFTVSSPRSPVLACIEPVPTPQFLAPPQDAGCAPVVSESEAPPYHLASIRASVLLI